MAFIRTAKASIKKAIERLRSIFAVSKTLTWHSFRYRTLVGAQSEFSAANPGLKQSFDQRCFACWFSADDASFLLAR